jgi:hypothetical protein
VAVVVEAVAVVVEAFIRIVQKVRMYQAPEEVVEEVGVEVLTAEEVLLGGHLL